MILAISNILIMPVHAEETKTDGTTVTEENHTHIYGEWEITEPATDDKPGVRTRKCQVEGCTKVETSSYVKVRDIKMTYIFGSVGILMLVGVAVIVFSRKKKES